MSMQKISTLEDLIEGLDQRGLLVLQVLIGQKAMELLALEKLNSTSLIKPQSQGIIT